MRQAFDIFLDGDDLLEILVLPVSEDGVVDNDPINGVVAIGGY